jgi:uncharacterized membrane protein YkvI
MGTSFSASAMTFLTQMDMLIKVAGGVLFLLISIMTLALQIRQWRRDRSDRNGN